MIHCRRQHRVRPAQPLCQQRVGEPGPDSALKASALGCCESAEQRSHGAVGRREMPELVGQFDRRFVIPGKPQGIEKVGDVRLRQQIFQRPCRQPAPAQKHTAGGADVIARPCEQHGIAQGGFVLDAPGLLRRHRRCRKRQPLTPGAGPSLLPAHHRIERSDGGAGGEREILNISSRNALRVRDGPAQPGGNGRCRCGRGCTATRHGVARREFGTQNHQWQDGS